MIYFSTKVKNGRTLNCSRLVETSAGAVRCRLCLLDGSQVFTAHRKQSNATIKNVTGQTRQKI